MITRAIRAFVERDWDRAREAKDRYWARRIADLGAGEGLRIADELRRQMLVVDPHWPDENARAADLRAHVRLSDLMRRGCPARRT